MKLELILEKSKDALWGRIESLPGTLLTTSGETVEEVTANLRDLITDYFEYDAPEKRAASEPIEFDYTYDLTAFADAFDALQLRTVAEKTGIGQPLMHQFATGEKRPSVEQAKRIEAVLHEVEQSLVQVSLG